MNRVKRKQRNHNIRRYYGNNIDLQNMTEEEKNSLYYNIPEPINSISTSSCTTTVQPTPPIGWEFEKGCTCCYCEQAKENNMTATTTFETERRVLAELSYSIERDKTKQARKAFHMDLYRPSTYGELRKLIKDQKVDLHPDYSEYEDDEAITEYTSPASMLTFNYQKPDRKGYKEVYEKIAKEGDKLRTHIKIFSPEESFKKLEEFEKKTFH